MKKIKAAIMAFSQSEKIKAGLIWVSQSLQLLNGLQEPERSGAEKVSQAMVGMLAHEIQLGRNMTGDASWEAVSKHLERARVMIDSGVGAEAVVNLTQALSQVTTIGHRSMSMLKEEGLL
jgi:hypothetical protein